MRILFVTLLVLGIGLSLFVPTMAQEASNQVSAYTIDGTRVPEVSARAWGMFDTKTGQLLFGRDVNGVHPIASVTKLMTAEVALDTLPLEAITTLSQHAIATESRAGNLEAGEEYTIRELLFPLLLPSSNDAAEAIAEYAGHDTFIAAMNKTAQRLGMTNTTYADPSGLSASSVSSVTDMATLLTQLMQDKEYLLDISQLEKYVGKEHTWRNVNKISHIETFRGGKHGYTDEADRTLAALFEEELSHGRKRNITIVLLGSNDLQTDVEILRTFLRSHVSYE